MSVARPTFGWTAGQADANYVMTLDGEEVASGIGRSSFTPTADLERGTHTWSVRATDHPGNVATSQTRTFRFAKPGKLKILSSKPFAGKGGGAVAKVRISEAGSVKAGARLGRSLLAKGSKRRKSGGVFKLRIRTTPKGRKRFAAATARAKLKVTFRPATGGKPASGRRSIKLHR